MRAIACLLAIILSVLIVQPAFTNFTMKAASSSCTKNKPVKSTCSKKKAKPVCSKNKCKPPKESKSKNPCGADRCNPLLGCPSGNFYAIRYSHIIINPIITSKQETPLFKDNSICKQLTECWHPPEII